MVVSNHGGRQLDGAPSSIAALPAIADAHSTLIGRAFLYGLGALGEARVARCAELIRHELDITIAFCGRTDMHQC